MTSGIEGLFKKNKVDYIKGWGKLTDKNTINVDLLAGGAQTLNTKNVILATGSDAIPFPNAPFDEKVIISSTGALSLDKVPESMIVIGGGVIGIEMGQVYQRFGTKVSIIEYADRIVTVADGEISKTFHRILTKQGIKIHTSHKVTKIVNHGDHAEVTYEPVAGGAPITEKCTNVLVATGRAPFTEGLGAKEIGIKFDNKNRV